MLKRLVSVLVAVFVFTTVAVADDWVVAKIRGGVFVFKHGEWVQLTRGDVVSDDSAIQTAKKSRATLKRGKESMALAPDTRIRIKDKVGSLRTVVEQDFGELVVDVEKRNVEHFEVRTPILAAVVKGTKFSVQSRGNSSKVKVNSGTVETHDTRAGLKVNVNQSQDVEIDRDDSPLLVVEGRGPKEPVVSTKTGKVLTAAAVIEATQAAHPKAIIENKAVDQIASQQGEKKSARTAQVAAQANQKAAQKQLEEVKESGDQKAIVEAQKEVDMASQSAHETRTEDTPAAKTENSSALTTTKKTVSAKPSTASTSNSSSSNSSSSGSSSAWKDELKDAIEKWKEKKNSESSSSGGDNDDDD